MENEKDKRKTNPPNSAEDSKDAADSKEAEDKTAKKIPPFPKR